MAQYIEIGDLTGYVESRQSSPPLDPTLPPPNGVNSLPSLNLVDLDGAYSEVARLTNDEEDALLKVCSFSPTHNSGILNGIQGHYWRLP
jgi:hypothetical protein